MKTLEVFVLAEEFCQSVQNLKTWQMVNKNNNCEPGDILLIQPMTASSDPNDRAMIARQVLHVMPLAEMIGGDRASQWDICSTTETFHQSLA